jgi:hypothetical protein
MVTEMVTEMEEALEIAGGTIKSNSYN